MLQKFLKLIFWITISLWVLKFFYCNKTQSLKIEIKQCSSRKKLWFLDLRIVVKKIKIFRYIVLFMCLHALVLLLGRFSDLKSTA